LAVSVEGVASMNNSIQHRGGGKFGRSQNSWPLVKLTIEDNSISMKTILQEVRINREFIEIIVLQRYFFNYQFIFKHHDSAIHKDIEFWTFSPAPLLKSLRAKGYTVTDER
jgi:hypothetical protein